MKTNEAQDMNRRFINARLSLKRVNKLVSELKAARSQKDVMTSIGDLFRALCKAGFNKKKIVCGVIKCIAMKRDFKNIYSFRGYDTIRSIEFCGNTGNGKYERGLFASRFTLGRLC